MKLQNKLITGSLSILFLAFIVISAGCDKGGSGITAPEPENTPPVADAGPDLTANVCQFVELDGTGSSDADGDPLTYSWNVVSGPADWALSFLGDAQAYFTDFENADVYEVELTVSDGTESDTDTTVITTNAIHAIQLEGRISSDSTLTDIFTCSTNKPDVYVTDRVIVEDGAMLTIEAGVWMAFAPNTYIEVGRDGPSGIRALGTEEAPVIMIADATDPQPGHWQGLTFWPDTHPDSRLVHTILDYCGQGQARCPRGVNSRTTRTIRSS